MDTWLSQLVDYGPMAMVFGFSRISSRRMVISMVMDWILEMDGSAKVSSG